MNSLEDITNLTTGVNELTNSSEDITNLTSKAYNPLYAYIVFSCITFYLCIVLSWNEVARCGKTRSVERRLENDSKFVAWMRWLCMLASYSLLLHIIFESIRTLHLPCLSLCKIIYILVHLSSPLTNFFVYGVLFVKQHMLYRNESVKHFVRSKCLGMLGGVAYGTYILAAVFVLILKFISIEIGFRGGICQAIEVKINLRPFFVSIFVSMLIAQIGFVILLLIPLLKYHLSRSNLPQIKKMMRIMYKSSTIAFVCVFTDITIFCVSMRASSEVIGNLVAGSYLVNCISIIFSFDDWRQRFFPMVKWPRNEKDSSTQFQSNERTRSSTQTI